MKMTCSIVILEKSFYNKESIFEIYIFFFHTIKNFAKDVLCLVLITN